MAAKKPASHGSEEPVSSAEALDGFSVTTRAWFEGAFVVPTQAQAQAWRAIGWEGTGGREGSGGKGRQDVLVIAPTGSGKTLAAFLWAIDRLAATPPPADKKQRCRVLYVSPLKALAVDIERNLRSPLTGIAQAARRLGLPEPEIAVATPRPTSGASSRRTRLTS
jgi:ATP-dependent Lhr-like helicase